MIFKNSLLLSSDLFFIKNKRIQKKIITHYFLFDFYLFILTMKNYYFHFVLLNFNYFDSIFYYYYQIYWNFHCLELINYFTIIFPAINFNHKNFHFLNNFNSQYFYLKLINLIKQYLYYSNYFFIKMNCLNLDQNFIFYYWRLIN